MTRLRATTRITVGKLRPRTPSWQGKARSRVRALPCPDGRRRRGPVEQVQRLANEPIVGPRIGAMFE